MASIAGCLSFQGQAMPLPQKLSQQNSRQESFNWISPDCSCWLQYIPSITDDSTYAQTQPIQSQCGRYTLIYSGRISNHLEVRRGLRYRSWHGDSDTETLVEGLNQRGAALLLDLKGIFAFAFYDAERKSLLLARDRIGIKPLYWQQLDSGLYFSTETRCLFSGRLKFTPTTISHYASFGYFPAEGELGEGIFPLTPGMLMRAEQGEQPAFVRWWPPFPRPDWTPLPNKRRQNVIKLVRQELKRSVREHMSEDSSISCLITRYPNTHGVAALAAQNCSKPLQTFSVYFQGADSGERKVIWDLAKHLGTVHEEIIITKEDYVELFFEAINNLDLPSFHSAHIYVICKALKLAGVKTILFNLDTQEYCKGYESSFRRVCRVFKLRIFNVWPQLIKITDPKFYVKLEDAPYSDLWHFCLANHRQVLNEVLNRAGLPLLDWPKPLPCKCTQLSAKVSWYELFGYTEPSLLRNIDKIGNIVGLDIRIPSFDHRLIELSLRVPDDIYRSLWQISPVEKACNDLLPKCDKKRLLLEEKEVLPGEMYSYLCKKMNSFRSIPNEGKDSKELIWLKSLLENHDLNNESNHYLSLLILYKKIVGDIIEKPVKI
ncbi:asparagine synthetase B family protein [Acaryochloris marina]|uniref:asparagine synthetase B family protein n=1 Tax=Acaryochloris marina TaxID=155978 RepID=UPI0021C42354|nr:asparagine synthetase B family protein [Acaryochloris marina]